MLTMPPGSWLVSRSSQIDLMVSADTVDVRNEPQQGPHSQAVQKRLSEILLPVTSNSLGFT